jgi:hypothetical protein
MIESDLYVDLRDDSLPRDTSKHTANMLRQRIAERDKFILLVTEKTKESIWVPWELGIADGIRGKDNIAVFPLSSMASFEGQEYLSVYNLVELSAMDALLVRDPGRRTVQEFSHWLHGVSWSKFNVR